MTRGHASEVRLVKWCIQATLQRGVNVRKRHDVLCFLKQHASNISPLTCFDKAQCTMDQCAQTYISASKSSERRAQWCTKTMRIYTIWCSVKSPSHQCVHESAGAIWRIREIEKS